MPPNLINILTNSTSNIVWHKLHPFRNKLAQFVYLSCFIQNPSELATKFYTPSEAGDRYATSREGNLNVF